MTSTEDNDATLTANIVEVLTKRDTLIICGDVVFTQEAYDNYFQQIIDTGAHIIIVLGNHDGEKPERKAILRQMAAAGVELQGMLKKQGFWITHAPMHPYELRGKKNIHGHMHDQLIRGEDGQLDTRYLNVCVEHTEFKPVKLQFISEYYDAKFEAAKVHNTTV
jgi:calcineurin-like phosphoesterase family protein